ncbi:hypothetical protein [Marininema halotolerans]|uniref:Uncharacterized protein n=1 Tax=Marininema halotolerans TaxID=1155944 RepID=A0A1I6RJD9_9BACL|nr:hypothetical protein [Marininema halotolerans]SFS64710.1 hypothetical protein SAMN05444972_105127 [Marininema halotolerans]
MTKEQPSSKKKAKSFTDQVRTKGQEQPAQEFPNQEFSSHNGGAQDFSKVPYPYGYDWAHPAVSQYGQGQEAGDPYGYATHNQQNFAPPTPSGEATPSNYDYGADASQYPYYPPYPPPPPAYPGYGPYYHRPLPYYRPMQPYYPRPYPPAYNPWRPY